MRYKAKNICAQAIDFDVEDNKVKNVVYYGGCPGNHLGIAALVEGRDIDDIISRLEGIPCGRRPTSCPDQLACALKEYKEGNLS